MKMETERLRIRELQAQDFDAVYSVSTVSLLSRATSIESGSVVIFIVYLFWDNDNGRG